MLKMLSQAVVGRQKEKKGGKDKDRQKGSKKTKRKKVFSFFFVIVFLQKDAEN